MKYLTDNRVNVRLRRVGARYRCACGQLANVDHSRSFQVVVHCAYEKCYSRCCLITLCTFSNTKNLLYEEVHFYMLHLVINLVSATGTAMCWAKQSHGNRITVPTQWLQMRRETFMWQVH